MRPKGRITMVLIGGPYHGLEVEVDGRIPELKMPSPPIPDDFSHEIYQCRQARADRFGSFSLTCDVLAHSSLSDDEGYALLIDWVVDRLRGTVKREAVTA